MVWGWIGCLAVSAVALAQPPAPLPPSVPAPPVPPPGAASHPLVGTWTQFYEDPATGKWVKVGDAAVAHLDGKLQMTIVELAQTPATTIKPRGIFNVNADGEAWTFFSDLGEGRAAYFKLRRVDGDIYEGYSYFNSVPHNRNIWKRKVH
jgi:hypothetical protein